MIAGGSGLTPMMQVASSILSNSDDKTEVGLLRNQLSSRNTDPAAAAMPPNTQWM